jgi:hypothetical protein
LLQGLGVLAALVADQSEQVYRVAAARVGEKQGAIVGFSAIEQSDFV